MSDSTPKRCQDFRELLELALRDPDAELEPLAWHEHLRSCPKCQALLEEEKAMLGDKRNQRTLSKVFSAVLGRELAVEIEDSDTIRPGAEDPYTKQVAELFDGQIED